MSEQMAAGFVKALRRTTSYVRLYGSQHPLTIEAGAETAQATNDLIGDHAGVVVGVSDDTLFVGGEPYGLTSLQFNGFLRDVSAADIETILMTGRVDPAELIALARVIAGESDEFGEGNTVRVNAVDLGGNSDTTSPAVRLRRSYTRSLDALRSVGHALREGEDISLDATATVVKELLERSMAHPTAALLLTTVKSHHEYTFYHSVNTSILALGLARLAGLPEDQQVMLGMGAMLHDIGKIGVSRTILQHPGRLTPEQWKEVRLHPQLGAEAILAASSPGEELAAVVALEHHARFDGSGYPRLVYADGTHSHGTSRHPLHFFSRLVAVTDTYDALTTRRSYRRAEPPSRALQVLVTEAGTSYDPDFVLAFASMMGTFPPGSFLRLASGAIVMVTDPSESPEAIPPAVLVRDAGGSEVETPEPIDYETAEIVEHVPPSAVGMQPAEILGKLELDREVT